MVIPPSSSAPRRGGASGPGTASELDAGAALHPGVKVEPGVNVGAFVVYGVSDGLFRLDGGAMFGVVPKVLWDRVSPADEMNRIQLGLHPILIRAEGRVILVETGAGSRHDGSFADRFSIRRPPTLAASLAAAGVTPEMVDVVVNTHLHWDHAGGNVRTLDDGTLSPTFPNATYVVQAADWDEALHPNERNRASYRSEDYLPLERAGRIRLVDGDAELSKGIHLERVGGHTRGMQIVRVTSAGFTLVYLADLVPTSNHLDYAWHMAYDLYPLDLLEQKKRVLREAAEGGWMVAFAHDPVHHFGRVRILSERGRERPVFEPLESR